MLSDGNGWPLVLGGSGRVGRSMGFTRENALAIMNTWAACDYAGKEGLGLEMRICGA